METTKQTGIKVKLVGSDSNAFAIIGLVSKALRRGGRGDLVAEFREKAMSGDYDNVLATCFEYVDVS